MTEERQAIAWLRVRAPEIRAAWHGRATGLWWAFTTPPDALVAAPDPAELLRRVLARRPAR